MIETKIKRTGQDELNQFPEKSWLSVEEKKCLVVANPVYIGEKVFSPEDHMIGRITKLFYDPEGNISHLSILSRHILGQHKIVSMDFVITATPSKVLLSINRKQFRELPDYLSDLSIALKVDRALWNDKVLRYTAYRRIDVLVQDGIVTLNGYVSNSSLWRVEKIVNNTAGILGVKSNLVVDENLLFTAAHALIRINRVEGSRVFAKVENGAVYLSGHVASADTCALAEQYVAEVHGVRAVINNIIVPGRTLNAEDQRFLQPVIGEKIYFRDGPFGVVKQVIINPNNQRVVSIIIEWRDPEVRPRFGPDWVGSSNRPKRLSVIPLSAIRYLTDTAGFLLIDSTDTSMYQEFDPDNVVKPEATWVPPYPYTIDKVSFIAV